MYEIDPQKYHMLTPKLHEQQRKFEDLCGDIWRQIRESIDKFPWLVEEKVSQKLMLYLDTTTIIVASLCVARHCLLLMAMYLSSPRFNITH